MKIELQEKLHKKYPKLFPNELYIECEDGWYAIIDTLCTSIQWEVDNPDWKVKKGFHHYVFKALLPIHNYILWPLFHKNLPSWVHPPIFVRPSEKELPEQPVILQLKEKYGTLRCYLSSSTDRIDAKVSLAENFSGHICELCGNAGKTTVKNGWYRTHCESCMKQNGFEVCPQEE